MFRLAEAVSARLLGIICRLLQDSSTSPEPQPPVLALSSKFTPSTKPLSLSLALPADVIIIILSYLPKCSQICLCLTNRNLWKLLSSTSLSDMVLLPSERLELLSLLDASLPTWAICYRHQKLHSRVKSNGRVIGMGWCDYGLPLKICNDYCVDHYIHDLVLRGHQLSPNHGIPVSVLEFEHIHQSQDTHASCATKASPHIIGNRLFLEIRFEITIRVYRYMRLKSLLLGMPCIHQNNELVSKCERITEELAEDGLIDEPYQALWSWHPISRCARCATDWRVHMIRFNGAQDWKIMLDVWKDLGGRGAPTSQAWSGHLAFSWFNHGSTKQHMNKTLYLAEGGHAGNYEELLRTEKQGRSV